MYNNIDNRTGLGLEITTIVAIISCRPIYPIAYAQLTPRFR